MQVFYQIVSLTCLFLMGWCVGEFALRLWAQDPTMLLWLAAVSVFAQNGVMYWEHSILEARHAQPTL